MPQQPLTPEQQQAIDTITKVSKAYRRAQKHLELLRIQRDLILRAEWPKVKELGPTRVSRETGYAIGEGTIRAETKARP